MSILCGIFMKDFKKKYFYKIVATIVTYESDIDDVVMTVKTFERQMLDSYIQIVDNNSSTIYIEKLKKALLKEMLPTNILNSQENKGFGFGHNFGIKYSPECDYYLVLNPDVIIHENTVVELIYFLEKDKTVGLVSPKILNMDGSIQYLNKRNPTIFDMFIRRFLPDYFRRFSWIRERLDYYVMADKGYEDLVNIEYMSGCFMLFRKNVLDAVKGFDENIFMYLEDADITRRVNLISRSVYFPFSKITHKWSRGSHHSLHLTYVTIKSAVYYFRKWGLKVF